MATNQFYRVASIGGNAWVYRNDGGPSELRKVFVGGFGTEFICERIAAILSDEFSGGRSLYIIEEINARAWSVILNGGNKYDAALAAELRAQELSKPKQIAARTAEDELGFGRNQHPSQVGYL